MCGVVVRTLHSRGERNIWSNKSSNLNAISVLLMKMLHFHLLCTDHGRQRATKFNFAVGCVAINGNRRRLFVASFFRQPAAHLFHICSICEQDTSGFHNKNNKSLRPTNSLTIYSSQSGNIPCNTKERIRLKGEVKKSRDFANLLMTTMAPNTSRVKSN